jgi:hypothetical protein
MEIYAAMKYIQEGGCACKHLERVLEKLREVIAIGIQNADIMFGQHSVVLNVGEYQEVLCSRFFEQRD